MKLTDIFKTKKEEIIKSPLAGKVIDLADVPDNVFTSNIIGEGCAIVPEPGSIYAPLSSKVEIFKTNHLLIFEPKKGVYVVVHFGVGTSLLAGKGFERIVELGPKKEVKEGTELVKYDLEFLKENASSVITPIIVSNDNIDRIEMIAEIGKNIKVGEDLLKIYYK